MSTEDQQLDENEESTLDETRESGDTAEELADLFTEGESEGDEPVSREEYNRLLKGTQKLATELGRIKAEKPKEEVVEKKEEPKSDEGANPVLKSLYFKANPEAQEIWDEVEREAKSLGKDPFTLYESSSYFKGEAKARLAEKTEEEANKAKLNRPAIGTGTSGKFDPSRIKPEDVEKLKPAEKAAWVRHQASKENEDD